MPPLRKHTFLPLENLMALQNIIQKRRNNNLFLYVVIRVFKLEYPESLPLPALLFGCAFSIISSLTIIPCDIYFNSAAL